MNQSTNKMSDLAVKRAYNRILREREESKKCGRSYCYQSTVDKLRELIAAHDGGLHFIWRIKSLYGCIDVAAQFDLHAHISNMKLEDFTGLDKYISKFKIAQSCFITMEVTFEEGEMVHLLIRNLLSDGVWPNFKQLLT